MLIECMYLCACMYRECRLSIHVHVGNVVSVQVCMHV